MNGIIGKFIDGGLVFTVPIFMLLLVIIGLFIWAFLKKANLEKAASLINHIGWFAVAWGFLGRTFGLIHAFDQVEAAGEHTTPTGQRTENVAGRSAIWNFCFHRCPCRNNSTHRPEKEKQFISIK